MLFAAEREQDINENLIALILIFCDYYTQHLWYPGLCISLGSWIYP